MSSRVFMATRVVIITGETEFSIQARAALERDSHFEVRTFDRARHALAHVKTHPQAAVIVDTRIDDLPFLDVIEQLQHMQPDIAILAAPDTETVRDLYNSHNIQAVIDLPIQLRRLMGIIKDAVNEMYEAQPVTQSLSASQQRDLSLSLNYHQTLEFWVSRDESDELVVEGTRPLEPIQTDELIDEEVKQATELFERLAAEEPPMPTGGTISDLQRQLVDPDDDVDFDEGDTQDQAIVDRATGRALAEVVLEAMRDQQATASLDEFRDTALRVQQDLETVSDQPMHPNAAPLELPQFTGPLEYTSPTTVPHQNEDTRVDPSDWRTDTMEPIRRSRPIDAPPPPEKPKKESSRPKPPPPPETDHIRPVTLSETVSTPLQMPFTEFDADDPDVAQMALTLTQVSLELTAEASLLTRAGQIEAYAGKLPPEEVARMGEILDGEWDHGEQKARIRFFRVVETGQDYMLYSRQLDEGYTLSLIFAGTMPVRNIRRQAQRLAAALETVPPVAPPSIAPPETQALREAEEAQANIETHVEEEMSEEIVVADVGERVPMTFVLVLDHVVDELSPALRTRARPMIQRRLAVQGWLIHEIALEPEFCYLFADVPAQRATDELLNELLTLSSEVLATDGPLWDDSYLVLQPGRMMQPEEVERVVEFARR